MEAAAGPCDDKGRKEYRLSQHIYTCLLLLLSLILAACGGSTTSLPVNAPGVQATPDDRVTVTFMTFPMEPLGLWEELIATFEEANPAIHIEPYYQEIPADWPRQADVALGYGLVWYQDAVDQGWLLDLAPLIESDREFESDDFFPGVLELFQQGGHIWAIPVGEMFDVLVYSPDLFREVGAPLPNPGWTGADLFEAARRIADSSSEKKRYSFLMQADVQRFGHDWIAEQSGGLYRGQSGSVVPDLDRPEVRQAVSDYLIASGRVTALLSGPRTVAVEEIVARMARGEVGMATMPLSTITDYLGRYPELAIAPLPPGDVAAQSAVLSCDELAISAGTAHPQAAWRWVHFLSRQNLGRHLPDGLPARRSMSEASGAWDQMSPEVKEVIWASLENQAGRPHLGLDHEVEVVYGALSKALAYIQEERIDIGAALANAQQEALADIQAWQERKASVTPTPFRVSAPLPSTGTTIEFQVTAYEQIYRTAAEAFENEHPGWHIRVSALGTTQPQGCLATTLNSDALTAVLTWDLLAELNPLTEADRRFSPDEFWPQAMAAVTWQGRLYGLPGSVKPLVLYYNPAVFERAGLAPPTSDWTVDDVLAAAGQIDAARQGDFGYLPQVRDIPFLLEQQGVSLFSADYPPRPHFTDPQVVQALDRLRRLGGGQMGFPAPFSEINSLIHAGRIGMWFEVFNYWSINPRPADTGVTAIQLRPGTTLPVQVEMFGLAAGSQQPQLCWEWINFLVQQGVCAPDGLPALRRLAASGVPQLAADNAKLLAAYREALRRSEQEPIRDTALEAWATWWFLQAIQGGEAEDLAAALQRAQDKAQAFLICLGPTGGQDLAQIQRCAQQADPEHPLAQLTP